MPSNSIDAINRRHIKALGAKPGQTLRIHMNGDHVKVHAIKGGRAIVTGGRHGVIRGVALVSLGHPAVAGEKQHGPHLHSVAHTPNKAPKAKPVLKAVHQTPHGVKRDNRGRYAGRSS